jgi:hypothetical protein
LEAIKLEVSNFHAGLKKHTKAITEATEAANANQSIPPEVHADVNFPQSIEVRKSATDTTGDNKYQRRTLFVASLTLIAIVVYSVLVYFQRQEMIGATKAAKESADATTKALHLDQRAWVTRSTGEAIIKKPLNDPILYVPFEIVNTGKTPALALAGFVFINLLLRDSAPDFSYVPISGGDHSWPPHWHTTLSPATLFPDRPASYFLAVVDLPEKQPRNIREFKSVVPTPQMLDDLKALDGKYWIVAHGKITYNDVLGINHWFTFCWSASGTNFEMLDAQRKCAAYNGIDGNQ